MDNNPTQTPSVLPPQPPTEPVKPSNSKVLLISLVILEIITLSAAGYFGYQYYQLKQQVIQNQSPAPSESPSINTIVTPYPRATSSVTTINWQTYSNATAGFSIKYPTGWRTQELSSWVGFGPQEIGEDVILGVSYYNKPEKTIAQIKDGDGKQFSDRKQTEETITFGGLTATKLITTTKQIADWYLVTIIIDGGNKLYAISNGAQTDEALNEMLTKRTGDTYNITFEDFYTSFKLTK